MADALAAPSSLRELPEARFGAAVAAALSVALLADAAGLTEAWAFVAMAAPTMIHAGRLPARFAMVLGLVAWGFFTGLVVNEHAELTMSLLDVLRLGVLLACAEAAHWVR